MRIWFVYIDTWPSATRVLSRGRERTLGTRLLLRWQSRVPRARAEKGPGAAQPRPQGQLLDDFQNGGSSGRSTILKIVEELALGTRLWCSRHHSVMGCLATPAQGRPGYQAWSRTCVPAGPGQTKTVLSLVNRFQDKMCVKVKCSKCQKTTWKGKYVMSVSVLLAVVAEYLGGYVRPEMKWQDVAVRIFQIYSMYSIFILLSLFRWLGRLLLFVVGLCRVNGTICF